MELLRQQKMASTSARPTAMASSFQTVDPGDLKRAIHRLTIPQIKPLLKEVSQIATLPMPATNVRKNYLVDSLYTMIIGLQQQNKRVQYLNSIRAIENKYGGSLFSPPNRAHYGPSYHPTQNPQSRPPQAQQHYHTLGQNPNANYYSDYPAAMHQQRTTPVPPKFGTFKESPFYTVKEWVPPAVMCAQMPEYSRPAGSAKISFNLTSSQCNELATASSRKQARLFCTTYGASRAALDARHPAPIEFPTNCEVRVNKIQLSVNLRGRKGPAKVLPPNLNKDKKLNLNTGRNEVELTYINTVQPYILTIGICETVSSEALVEQVKKDKVKSRETVLKEMKKAANDDDIEVGDVTVNLKCPLSYMRLKTPCRSSVCTHIQCFDALSFYSINEQTPSWQCPICSSVIDPKQLFVDGYVLDILQKVPESEELVQIDSEGRWRTPNNKYRSDNVAENFAANGSSGDVPSTKMSVSAPENGNDSPLTPLPRVKGEDESNPTMDLGASTAAEVAINGSSTTEEQQRKKKRSIEVVDLDDSPSPPKENPEKRLNQTNDAAQSTISHIPNGSSAQTVGDSSTRSAGGVVTGQSAESPWAEPHRPAVIDLTFSDSEEDDTPSERMQMPISRPIAGRPPGQPPVRPPSIPSKPSDLTIRKSAGISNVGRITPMPTPRLTNGMQSIDKFLVPREQAGQNNGRPSSSSFSNDVTEDAYPRRPFRPFLEWERDSSSWQNRDNDIARTRSEAQQSTSFNNEPTFARGIFHAPSSPNAPLNPSRGSTMPPSDPIEDRNALASSQTQGSETADEAISTTNERVEKTPTRMLAAHTTNEEDEDDDPIVRPHKRARHLATDEENEFEDRELDDLDVDPDAGFGMPNGHSVNRSNGNRSNGHNNMSGNADLRNRLSQDLAGRLFDQRQDQNSNDPSSVVSRSDPIPYKNTANEMGTMNDDDFEADERAGLGGN